MRATQILFRIKTGELWLMWGAIQVRWDKSGRGSYIVCGSRLATAGHFTKAIDLRVDKL